MDREKLEAAEAHHRVHHRRRAGDDSDPDFEVVSACCACFACYACCVCVPHLSSWMLGRCSWFAPLERATQWMVGTAASLLCWHTFGAHELCRPTACTFQRRCLNHLPFTAGVPAAGAGAPPLCAVARAHAAGRCCGCCGAALGCGRRDGGQPAGWPHRAATAAHQPEACAAPRRGE